MESPGGTKEGNGKQTSSDENWKDSDKSPYEHWDCEG